MAEILTHSKFDRAPVFNEKTRGKRAGAISLLVVRRRKVAAALLKESRDLQGWAFRLGMNPDLPIPELQRMKAKHEALQLAQFASPEASEIAQIKKQAMELYRRTYDIEQRIMQRIGAAHD